MPRQNCNSMAVFAVTVCSVFTSVNVKKLPGTPDIVLRKYRTVIFVNGCFWHGHEGCKYYVLPKTNTEFWKEKIERNKERDLKERMQLRNMGWHVILLWECQLKSKVREQNLKGLVSVSYTHLTLPTNSLV